MPVIVHCRVNMFDTNAIVFIEKDGEIVEDSKESVPVKDLESKLTMLVKQYSANKVHLIGSTQYLRGIARRLQRSNNFNFSHCEIEVN